MKYNIVSCWYLEGKPKFRRYEETHDPNISGMTLRTCLMEDCVDKIIIVCFDLNCSDTEYDYQNPEWCWWATCFGEELFNSHKMGLNYENVKLFAEQSILKTEVIY